MSGTTSLTRRQGITLVTVGIVLWFLAAMLLRALGPTGIYEGSARIRLYVLVIPGTWPFVLMTARLAGLAPGQALPGLAIVTGTAALLDGIALAWVPQIYGDSAELVAGAGGAILWGAGVGLALALVHDRRQARLQ